MINYFNHAELNDLNNKQIFPKLGNKSCTPSIEWNYQEFDEIYNNSSHNTYEVILTTNFSKLINKKLIAVN